MRLGTTGYQGLITNGHGGACCGIRHIYSFPIVTATIAEKVEWIKVAVKACVNVYDENTDLYNLSSHNTDAWQMLIEVVLIGNQLPCWQEALLEVGFKLISMFRNSNSGNTCYVFHLGTNGAAE